jgi:glycosyltransferase involved in cell wall biosynthesis
LRAPTAVLVSFRLGGSDGVSIEAAKWEWALGQLGFATRRVAGELTNGLRPDDTWLPFLAMEPVEGAAPEHDALAAALAGVDLVVVENLCSLPVNLTAARTTAAVLAGHAGRVLFHHHDLPWERDRFAHLTEFPPHRPNSLHVTINDHARRALAERGIAAHTIRNAFDLDPLPGDRPGTRAQFGLAADAVVVLQPTRAIPRKEVGRAIGFTEQLASQLPGRNVDYWLTGPAEEGYETELAQLLDAARVPVSRGRATRPQDAYAAADVIVFPSSTEGFGNPVIEGTIAQRPVAVAHYPVLDEFVGLGLRLFSVDDPGAVASWLRSPDPEVMRANRAGLQAHFDLADLPDRIRAVLAAVGWTDW